jgi:hypothetical protein
LEGDEFEYFYFVTNDGIFSEEEVIAYDKLGNADNYINEVKYDMAIGHRLFQSLWIKEVIFQLKMLDDNLFLLVNMDFANRTAYRQQIKTFRLKYIFLAWKIIMKLSEKYNYREMYEQNLA